MKNLEKKFLKKNFEKFFPLKILEKKIFEKIFPLKNPLGASGENMNVLSFIFIISKHRCSLRSLDAARPCALRSLTSI